MILTDVNVLVYAYRRDAVDHASYRAWLEALVTDEAAFGMSELVLSGFVRLVTNRRVFPDADRPQEALAFVDAIRERSNCVAVRPGPRHWRIFADLCVSVNATGNLVPDAYHAALAIESGSEWVTTDRGYARFPGLRWRHPLSD